MSVAFLEATINELFDNCADYPEHATVKPLPTDRVRAAAMLWSHGVPRSARHNILDKYKIAAGVFDVPLDLGKRPAQDVAWLIAIRNDLVHAEPAEAVAMSTIPEYRVTPDKHGGAKQRFSENPLVGSGGPYFPDRMLSADCARWAVESAVAFVDEFFAALGVRAPHDHVRREMAP